MEGGRLIGGRLIEVGLYLRTSESLIRMTSVTEFHRPWSLTKEFTREPYQPTGVLVRE